MISFPRCGCLPGDSYNGWLEIRSSYCLSEERRQFGLVNIIYKRIHDRIVRENLLRKANNAEKSEQD